jgi:hypothetical protein
METMRPLVPLAVLLALLVPAGAGAERAATHLTFQVRFIQEATYQWKDAQGVRHFRVTLHLFANGPNPFNAANNRMLGTTTFSYELHGSCSSGGGGCKGTTDIDTVTKLPGGSIVANGLDVPLAHPPYTVAISKGSGRFAGATGKVEIALGGKAYSLYDITLP